MSNGIIIMKGYSTFGHLNSFRAPLKPPFIFFFARACIYICICICICICIYFTNIVTYNCPRGKVCVLMLMIANSKAMYTSLTPFNPLKEVLWNILYDRCQITANFFLLFWHLNSHVVQSVHSASLYKLSYPSWRLETIQMTPCTSNLKPASWHLRGKVKQLVHFV